MADLQKRQIDIAHIFVQLLQSTLVEVLHRPIAHLCAKIGALYLSDDENRCFENLDAAGALLGKLDRWKAESFHPCNFAQD